MTNLYSGTINTRGQYQNLATLTGLTFTVGTKYTIQIQNSAYIREGEVGNGFLISNIKPFILDYKGGDVFIKTEFWSVVVNIAD